MDGVRYRTSRPQESFTGSPMSAHTLSRLANFITQADTKQHTRSHQQFSCPQCDQCFSFGADLMQHQEEHHTSLENGRCHSCGRKLSSKSSCCGCITHTQDIQTPPLDTSPNERVPLRSGFKQKDQQASSREPPSMQDILINPSNLHNDSSPFLVDDSTLSASPDASTLSAFPDASSPNQCSTTPTIFPFWSRCFRKHWRKRRHSEYVPLKPKKDVTAKRYLKKRRKLKNKILKCRSCEMVFSTAATLRIHRREKHSREIPVRTEPKLLTIKIKKKNKFGTYPCQVCGKVFFHHLSRRAHYRHAHIAGVNPTSVQTPPDKYLTKVFKLSEIRVCLSDITQVQVEGRTPRKVSRVDHPESREEQPTVEEEEEEVEEEVEVDREFPCPSCPEVFPLQWQLKEHVELHQSSARSSQCSVCSQHMGSQKGPSSRRQRLYHCVPCQQGFSALDSFLQHCQEHLRLRVEEDGIAGAQPEPSASV